MKKKGVLLVVALLSLDLLSKLYIDKTFNLYETHEIIRGFFSLTKVYNTGASFSMLANYQPLLIIISIIILLFTFKYQKSFVNNNRNILAFSMLYAGILGNLINRIIDGHVVDFLDFNIFNYDYPVFNIADIFIFMGVCLIIFAIIKRKIKMKIISDSNDIRIDKYLALNTPYSRELITKMIQDEYVLVNNKKVKPSYKVQIDDQIDINEDYKVKEDIIPTKMDINIVYEDDDIIVIDKQSGVVVHPGNGNYSNTLVNGLKYYTDNLSDIGGEERVGIVHRLDKDTSGLMLVAKSNKAHEILSDDFKNKRVFREYYALLVGLLPTDNAFIDAPIGRSKQNFNKMEVRSDGKVAKTHIKVLKRYKNYTLVSVVLETGRTHQIRVHTSYIGYPVYNDPVYCNKEASEFGQFLHSKKIEFIHPITKEKMTFESELPKEFKSFLDTLD